MFGWIPVSSELKVAFPIILNFYSLNVELFIKAMNCNKNLSLAIKLYFFQLNFKKNNGLTVKLK